ncbi:MAG: methyltransferase domain-containing protein [Gammaproteobacteria bacterium]|nr:methyltransferase domain-containing protein [Gammaproteobacteria bacterium]
MKDRKSRTGHNLKRWAAKYGAPVYRHLLSADFSLFVRALCASPRGTGSACPSSRYLARTMAREAVRAKPGLVVELGAGTGVVTRALLEQGITPDHLVVIERSPLLAAHLREKFPHVRIIEGDAARLGQLLAGRGLAAADVTAVVSSLPLKSLPAISVARIGRELNRVLPAGTLFVQFTYSLRAGEVGWRHTARCVRSRTVWRNVPPARVNSFAWGC